jgi:large subunit ribosomal protein L9
MPTTEIILTEKVYNLGAEADVVKVKAGYARNFLIPQGKALEVTPTTLRRLNILKAKRAEREAKEMNDAQEVARKISKIKLEIELETGETGKAFGSVTAADIAQKLQAALGGGIEIDRHKIELERPIKDSGKHEVVIKLHHDVNATVEVNITAKGAAPAAKADGEAEGDKTPGSYKAKAKAKHKTAKTDNSEAKE